MENKDCLIKASAKKYQGITKQLHGLVPGGPGTGIGKMGGLAPGTNCGGMAPGTGSIGGGIIGRRGRCPGNAARC